MGCSPMLKNTKNRLQNIQPENIVAINILTICPKKNQPVPRPGPSMKSLPKQEVDDKINSPSINPNIRSTLTNQNNILVQTKTASYTKVHNFEINQLDKITIKKALSNHFLFKGKASQIISILIENLEMIKVLPNTFLFHLGDKGDCFYIIKEGRMELETEYGKKILNPNDTFGELALIQCKKRTASVKSIDNCVLFCLNGKVFREIVTKISENELKSRLSFLKIVPIFSKDIYLQF